MPPQPQDRAGKDSREPGLPPQGPLLVCLHQGSRHGSRGGAAASPQPGAVASSSRSQPDTQSSSWGHPAAGRWGKRVGNCPAAVLLQPEGRNIGPLWEGERGAGHPQGCRQCPLRQPQESPAPCLRSGGSSQLPAAGWSWCLLPMSATSSRHLRARRCQSRPVRCPRLRSDPPAQTTQT